MVGGDAARLVVPVAILAMSILAMPILAVMRMSVPVSVMMIAAAQQDGAGDVHRKAEAGDRDGLGEMDGHRSKDAGDGLVADQHRDHGKDDGAGEAGEVAELARAEGEARIVGVPARIAIGQGSKQQRTRMRAHMQAVGDERDRAEQQAADDLGDHHGAA